MRVIPGGRLAWARTGRSAQRRASGSRSGRQLAALCGTGCAPLVVLSAFATSAHRRARGARARPPSAMRMWPCDEVRDRGLHRSRLALACAQAGELDRAKAEGAQALVTAKQTGSVAAARDLRRLGAVLRTT